VSKSKHDEILINILLGFIRLFIYYVTETVFESSAALPEYDQMYCLKHLLDSLQSKPVAKHFQGRQHVLQEWHVLAPQP